MSKDRINRRDFLKMTVGAAELVAGSRLMPWVLNEGSNILAEEEMLKYLREVEAPESWDNETRPWKSEINNRERKSPGEVMLEGIKVAQRSGVKLFVDNRGVSKITMARAMSLLEEGKGLVNETREKGFTLRRFADGLIGAANDGFNNNFSDLRDVAWSYNQTPNSPGARGEMSPMMMAAISKIPKELSVESGFEFYEKFDELYAEEMVTLLNEIKDLVGKKGKRLSMGEMLGYMMVRNKGDVISGLYEAATVSEFVTRSNYDFQIDEKTGQIKIGKDAEGKFQKNSGDSKLENDNVVGCRILTDLVEDNVSLTHSVQWLVPAYGPTTETSTTYLRQLQEQVPPYLGNKIKKERMKNGDLENRAGCYYHGYSAMLLSLLTVPELENAFIGSYYFGEGLTLNGGISSWKDLLNPETFKNFDQISAHGWVKVLSDIRWSMGIDKVNQAVSWLPVGK